MELYKQAKLLLEGLGVSENEETFEMALAAINRFGSYKNVLMESDTEAYAFKKPLVKLIKLSTPAVEEDEHAEEAEAVLTLLHRINRTMIELSQSRGEDYRKLMANADLRKMFKLDGRQADILNRVGGRELIMTINQKEPNHMIRAIIAAIKNVEKRSAHDREPRIGHSVTNLLNR